MSEKEQNIKHHIEEAEKIRRRIEEDVENLMTINIKKLENIKADIRLLDKHIDEAFKLMAREMGFRMFSKIIINKKVRKK